MGNRDGVCVTRKVRRKAEREQWERQTWEEVNEEDLDVVGAGGTQAEEREQGLDPVQVQQVRNEEPEHTIKTLQTFELSSLQEAMSRDGRAPTTTKWVDRTKKNSDGKESVKCHLVARDVKPKREGPRDDLFAAIPLLEAKALFAFVEEAPEKRRERELAEMKLMLVDEKKKKKVHMNARCDEEERVELPDEFEEHGGNAKLRRWMYGDEEGRVGGGTTTTHEK